MLDLVNFHGNQLRNLCISIYIVMLVNTSIQWTIVLTGFWLSRLCKNSKYCLLKKYFLHINVYTNRL